MKKSLPFTWRGQSFTSIYQSILVWALLTWVNPWCMTFITTTLWLNMGITQNYSSLTLTLLHVKLRPKIFTKISIPALRNGWTIVTTQIIIHLELKQDLIVKCLECLNNEADGKQLLNLLVWELNFTPAKCLMALKIKKHVSGVEEYYKREYCIRWLSMVLV